MMNRIFDPEEPIDLPLEAETTAPPAPGDDSEAAKGQAGSGPEGSPPPPPPTPLRPRRPNRRPLPLQAIAAGGGRQDDRLLLIAALAGVCMVSVAGSLLYFGYWNRLQQNLTQERNLLLVERLRSLGPATAPPAPAPTPTAPALPAPAGASAPSATFEDLPPPPPEEPWIEQLSSLPSQRPAPTPSRVLTVPVPSRLATGSRGPTPARSRGPLPQLVGVVGGAGRASSAIFLVRGSSMSVGAGELIGSSGWRLRSAEGEMALIERDGEVRQLSIVSGNGF